MLERIDFVTIRLNVQGRSTNLTCIYFEYQQTINQTASSIAMIRHLSVTLFTVGRCPRENDSLTSELQIFKLKHKAEVNCLSHGWDLWLKFMIERNFTPLVVQFVKVEQQ
jgi:hypothetical protein